MNKSSFELKEKENSMQKSLTEKINIAGKDWINSKYKKIISYLTALIRKSNEALENSLNVRSPCHLYCVRYKIQVNSGLICLLYRCIQ